MLIGPKQRAVGCHATDCVGTVVGGGQGPGFDPIDTLHVTWQEFRRPYVSRRDV